MPCEESQRLSLACETAAKRYELAIEQESYATADRYGYENLKRFSDEAFNKCRVALSRLEEHRLQHCCQNNSEPSRLRKW